MVLFFRPHFPVATALLVLVVSGCQSGGGPAVDAPSVDPVAAAAAAIEQYDKDGDGSLSQTELAACPGLLPALSDGKKKLTQEEIAAHLESMFDAEAWMISFNCLVYVNGQPLSSAAVKLTPEKFLGGSIQSGEGTTDTSGSASIAIPDEKLPERDRGLNSMQPGIFKVEITHPSLKIPSKYNTETTLGTEVNPLSRSSEVVFRLKGK